MSALLYRHLLPDQKAAAATFRIGKLFERIVMESHHSGITIGQTGLKSAGSSP